MSEANTKTIRAGKMKNVDGSKWFIGKKYQIAKGKKGENSNGNVMVKAGVC